MALSSEQASHRLLLSTEITRERDVRLFRRELRHALGGLDGVSPRADRLDDFVLAVNEAVANVFRHAYPDGDHRGCRVRVARHPEALVATIEDDGESFDPRSGYATMPKDESGRGFRMIRSLVDALVCDVTDSGGGRIEVHLAL